MTLKPGSKKKRSKEELKQVASIEAQLKQDKQAFLVEMKRLQDLASMGRPLNVQDQLLQEQQV